MIIENMRFSLSAALVGAALLVSAAASADSPPDAAKVRLAATQFESGAVAYKKGLFEEAASAFEAADAAVPSAKPLRLAILARTEAKQGSRAATLAAAALGRYPTDAEMVKLANQTISKFGPSLQKVTVECASPCVLAVGSRAIAGEPNTRWSLYLDPGTVAIGASFFGDAGSVSRTVDGKAGAALDLRLEPAHASSAAAATAPTSAAPTTAETPPPAAPTASAAAEPAPEQRAPAAPATKSHGISPAFFITGLVATAAVGGVTVWSGIDTQNNPGPDAVRAACAGKGETCPEYEAGRSHQLRTNILLGATLGAAAITGVLAIFTDFGGHADPSASPSKDSARLTPGVWIADGGGLSLSSSF